MKINLTHARLRDVINVIGNTKKNMDYVKKDTKKASYLHESLSKEIELLSSLTLKSHDYASNQYFTKKKTY